MVCAQIFNCNLRQQQAKDGGGRVVIGELLVCLCGITCVVPEKF